MQRYVRTKQDELGSLFPVVPDRRPRALLPIVQPDQLAAEGVARRLGPFYRPLNVARLIAPVSGHDVWSAASDPTVCIPPLAEDQTWVDAVAMRSSPRELLIRLRFECRSSDMPAIRTVAGTEGKPATAIDYVSILGCADRTMEVMTELGVNIRGEVFLRRYRQFAGVHNSQPVFSPEPPQVLSTSAAIEHGEAAIEEKTTRTPSGPHGRVQLLGDRWIGELTFSATVFGDYLDEGVVIAANFVRFETTRPAGVPAGISWKAGINGQSWSPFRFLPTESGTLGFLAIGDLSPEAFERQIIQIDQDAGAAEFHRRTALAQRRADAAHAWRERHQPEQLDTQWSFKAVSEFAHVDRGFVLNNSRQLVTLEDGRTLVLAEDRHRLALVYTAATLDPVKTSFDGEPIVLLGDGGAFNPVVGDGEVSHASMLIHEGRVHITFAAAGSCWHACHPQPASAASLGVLGNWKIRNLNAAVSTRPYDIEVLGSAVVIVLADARERLSLVCIQDEPSLISLAFEGRCPVLARADDGGLHMAFERLGTIYYVRFDRQLKQQATPVIAAYGVTFHPAIIEYLGQPLIAYQWFGVNKASPEPSMYIAERERTGCGIGCAYRAENGAWRRQLVMDYKEVMVRRLDATQYMLDMVHQPHNGRAFALPDENWRPCIGRDANGVVRVAWQNTTRRHAFVAQWNGQAFNRPEELIGPLPAPTPRIGLEKYAPPSTQLRLIAVAEERLLVDGQPLQALHLDRSPDVYFLDELAVQRRSNLRWQADCLQRWSEDPIVSVEEASDGSRSGLSRPNVAPAAEGGGYVMVVDTHQRIYRFAHSPDGYQWRLIDREEFEQRCDASTREWLEMSAGEQQGMMMGYSRGAVMSGMEDVLEKDPAKRFKRMLLEGRQTDPNAVRRIYYSADGVHWEEGPAAINNVHLNETHLPNLYDLWDTPARRFKIYGRTTTAQGRTLAMLWSEDYVHWQGDVAPVMADHPFSRPAPAPNSPVRQGWVTLEGSASASESEHYFCVPWQEAGLYMLMYANLNWDGKKSLRLAFSRDGFHFKRVGDVPLLDVGAPGAFDAGSINHPVRLEIDDKLLVYYGGGGEKHGSLPYTAQHCIGLATIARKRWSHFKMEDPAGSAELVTVPISTAELRDRRLTVNMACPTAGGVAVEVVDASTGRPVEGFTAADCAELCEGLDVPVQWKGQIALPTRVGAVQLRFVFAHRDARLYGFSLPMMPIK